MVFITGSSLGEENRSPISTDSANSNALPAPRLIQDTLPATTFDTVGDQITFTTAFSFFPAANFQWQKISGGATNDISGATNSTLTLDNLQLSDRGAYRLRAVNAINDQAITYSSVGLLAIDALPAATNNIVSDAAAQTGPEGARSFTPTWSVTTNNNLVAGRKPANSSGNFSLEARGRQMGTLTSADSLQLGHIGGTTVALTTSANYVTCGNNDGAGSSVTYTLGDSACGYNLTNITVYGGWCDGGRAQQAYTVYYSTVTSPALFIPLARVNFKPSDPANAVCTTRVRLEPVTGVLAKNVAAVKFDFMSPTSENGYCGYAKIILAGFPAATLPPPDAQDNTQFWTRINNRHPLDRLDLLGSWIWDAKTFDRQTCFLWRTFDIPANGEITKARILMTADNEFTLFIDGHEMGRGAEWQELFDYNLLPLQMAPGRHTIAIKAFNFARLAGVILGLRIDLADGRFIEIKSDENWKIVPNETRGWEKLRTPQPTWAAATVVAPIGTAPWWSEPAFVNVLHVPPPPVVFFWQTTWFQISFLTVAGLLLLTIIALTAQLALHRKERWLLQRERARIAMDVHDDIGSRITQLVLTGEDVQEALPADSPVRIQLGEIWDDAREVLSSIDEILWALNPRLDTLRDFADYICDYTHNFLEPSGIESIFEVDANLKLAAADLPLRRSLLMAIKETLNNVVKHSGATFLRLKIERQRHHLVIIVQDNGNGFDPAAITEGRHGLGNLSRRMQELGGDCRISSLPGKGCRIEFRIPLKRTRLFSWFRK